MLYHEDKDIFQKDLEEEFGLRAPSASILVKKMEDDGLITRASVSYDGRLKKIIPSEKARTYHDQVVSDVESLESSLVEGISKEEQQQWLAITKKMIENLKK
ncbi:MarR family winged helix-turn-helix transcriptional regulator [Lactimicrobium sp.]|uniref:MarR family winged helix-turn-helix transcriptional regulator n=1 Tax=Lactimicrobium sp. TaxID=2563780 RepID=UPI003FA55946